MRNFTQVWPRCKIRPLGNQNDQQELNIWSSYTFFQLYNHWRQKCEGSSPNSLWPISYFGSIWELHFLDLKTKVFVGIRTSYIFPWTRDSQCQNSANSLAESTPNASKIFWRNLSAQAHKFWIFEKKLSLGVRSPCIQQC